MITTVFIYDWMCTPCLISITEGTNTSSQRRIKWNANVSYRVYHCKMIHIFPMKI